MRTSKETGRGEAAALAYPKTEDDRTWMVADDCAFRRGRT